MNRTGSHTLLVLVVLCSASVVGVAVATGAGAAQSSCSFPVTETDATGTDVTIDEYPDRIVTLGGSAAQTVWEIGDQDRVVGITEYAQYLDGTSSKTVVGGFTISVETVVDQNPDLVLAPNTITDETVSKLRETGLTVYKFSEATSVEFIADKTELTGELIGSCQAGVERADEFREDVETIQQAVENRHPEPALHILGASGYAAGDNTFITEMIETAGGTNLASDDFDGYRQLSTEVILAENPQWITRPRAFDLSPYAGTTAVDEGQVLTLEENYISQPAPRTIQPMVTMVEHWHPAAYQNAQLGDVSSNEDRRSGPQHYSTLRTDGTAYLRISNFRHSDPYVAEFSLPAGFGTQSDRAPSLTGITVEPTRTDLAIRLYVSPRDGNVSLPNGYEPVSGYQITAGSLASSDVANLTGTVEFNTTARDVAASDLAAFTRESGTWTQLPLRVQEFDTTLDAQFNATSFGTVYLATGGNDTATLPSENGTNSGNGTATLNETARDATPTANGTATPDATDTPTDQPQTAGPTDTPVEDVGTDQSGPGTESGADTATQAETAGSSGPGFGLVATLLAIGVLTVAAIHTSARRRP